MADSNNRKNTSPYASTVDDNNRLYWGQAAQLAVVVDSENNISWGDQTTVADYPAEVFVKDGTVYDNGNKTGSYGRISGDNDIATQIKNNIETEMADVLPEAYTKLSRIYDLEKNNFKQNKKRYGARILSASQADNLQCADTTNHTFEVILTTNYVNGSASALNDEAQQQAVEELFTQINKIYKRVQRTRAGSFSNVLVVNSCSISEPEFFDAQHNMVSLSMSFNVKYKQNH